MIHLEHGELYTRNNNGYYLPLKFDFAIFFIPQIRTVLKGKVQTQWDILFQLVSPTEVFL